MVQVIVSLNIPFSNEYTWFRSFKISQRAEVIIIERDMECVGGTYQWFAPVL